VADGAADVRVAARRSRGARGLGRAVEDKEALIAADPFRFFTTPHYGGQPVVLVRLEAIDADETAELIVDSWLLRAPRSLTRPAGDRWRLISTVTSPSRDDPGYRASE